MSPLGPSRHLGVPQNLVAIDAKRTLAIFSARQIYGITALRRSDTGSGGMPDGQISSFYQKRLRLKSSRSRENILLPIFGKI
jgi:hypothetical protein